MRGDVELVQRIVDFGFGQLEVGPGERHAAIHRRQSAQGSGAALQVQRRFLAGLTPLGIPPQFHLFKQTNKSDQLVTDSQSSCINPPTPFYPT